MTTLRDKAHKRERIVAAAAKAFARRGLRRTLMADIATEAGVGKGTLYEYFRSKEELFLAVFEWFGHQLARAATVEAQALRGTATDRLRAYVRSVTAAFREHEEIYTLTMEFWAAASSSEVKETLVGAFRHAYREHRTLVEELIRDGIGRGEFRGDIDVEAVAATLVGALDGVCLQAWFDSAVDPVSWSESFLDALVTGLVLGSQGGHR